MLRFNHSFTSLLAVLLALTLFPFTALAVTENVLESAPDISLPEETGTDPGEELPEEDRNLFLPSAGMLPERETVQRSEELNLPRLTNAELAMVQELLAARDAGKQAAFNDRHYANAEKVFEAGVYPLDPEDFSGRTFYVVLPYFQMNRDQLLSLISAFEELGIPFDPESLDGTNCVRGTSLLYNAATRELTWDEQNRIKEILRIIRNGVFDREAFTAPSACRSILVQLPGYSQSAYEYLEYFSFYPYRAMTDDELAAFALQQESGWEILPDLLEKKARQYAHKVFPLPLSMAATEASRYAYSEDYIEFRNYFSIDPDSCGSMYGSPEETPDSVMVEQNLIQGENGFPEEAYVARIIISYPYEADETGSGVICSMDELKASAQRWAENYLLVPEEDILSEWVFDTRIEDWGTVQYRLLTTEWLVCLEMYEADARYFQCCIYDRDSVVEFDDWVLKVPAGTGEKETAGTDEPVQDPDRDLIDENARQSAQSLLNLPAEMTMVRFSRNTEGYVQYRTDYSFSSGENFGMPGQAGTEPEGMIVYQTPNFTETAGLHVECIFLSYPYESGYPAGLTDEEYRSAAQKWADTTLKIPAEDILEDWSLDPASAAEGTVVYQLKTVNWTVYLQIGLNGEYCWCGLYPQDPAHTDND